MRTSGGGGDDGGGGDGGGGDGGGDGDGRKIARWYSDGGELA